MAGCASIGDLSDGCHAGNLQYSSPHVFGGTRSNLRIISGNGSSFSPLFAPCSIVDFPLSIVMDVVLLPVTVTTHLVRYGFGPELARYMCPKCQQVYYFGRVYDLSLLCPSDQTPLQPTN